MHAPAECLPEKGYVEGFMVRPGADPLALEPDTNYPDDDQPCRWIQRHAREPSALAKERSGVTLVLPGGLRPGHSTLRLGPIGDLRLLSNVGAWSEVVSRTVIVRVAYEGGECVHDEAVLAQHVGGRWESRWKVVDGEPPAEFFLDDDGRWTMAFHAACMGVYGSARVHEHVYWLPDDPALADGAWAILAPGEERRILARL